MSHCAEDVVEFTNQKATLAVIISAYNKVQPNDSRVSSIAKMIDDIQLPSEEVQSKVPDAVNDLCVQLQFLGNALHAMRMTPEISLETALAVGKLSAGFEFIDGMFGSGPVPEDEALNLLHYLCETFIIPATVDSKFPEGTEDALSVYGHVMIVHDDNTVTIKTKGGVGLVNLPYTPESKPH